MSYPTDRKQSGFAVRYLRWVTESGVALDVGPESVSILVAVVMLEDALHYKRAVNFYNEQLMSRAGFANLKTLDRARKRLVSAGLLYYEASAKRRPGVYWVLQSAPFIPGKNYQESDGFLPDSSRFHSHFYQESGEPPNPIKPHTPISKSTARKTEHQKPTINEVIAYAKERGSSIDPGAFFDHYQANGWVQTSGRPIKDWQAAFRNWERNAPRFGKPRTESPIKEFDR